MYMHNNIFKSFVRSMKTDTSSDCLRSPSDSGQQDIPRKRTLSSRLSEFQLSELTKRYKLDPYIKGAEKELMSRHLGITPSRVQIWFSERRKKERKESRQH